MAEVVGCSAMLLGPTEEMSPLVGDEVGDDGGEIAEPRRSVEEKCEGKECLVDQSEAAVFDEWEGGTKESSWSSVCLDEDALAELAEGLARDCGSSKSREASAVEAACGWYRWSWW